MSMQPAPRTGDTIEISGDYQHRARQTGFVVQRFWHAEKERVIARVCPPQAGERVLDVGCGSGVIAAWLAAQGAITTGVDGNQRAIAYARQAFPLPGLDFQPGLVEELNFAPATFDRIYCLELIEHLHEPQVRALLAQLQHLLKPGGTLFLTTPNYRGVWPLLEFTLDRLQLAPQMDGAQHVTHFHRQRLREVLHATGWQVERLQTFATIAPFLSVLGWQLALACARGEDRLDLPFGNLLLAVARKPCQV